MKKRGWTLIELLIVAGIIITLISLVLEIVRLGVNTSRKVQCINNLQQIYMAVKLYEEEFGAPSFRDKYLVNWNPNLKQIVICPSDPYKGYGDITTSIYGSGNYKEKFPGYVPFSYEIIYATWYWMLRIKPHFRGPEHERDWWEKDWQETIKAIRQRINQPDMPVVLCPYHDLAIFRDGNVGKAPPPIIIGPTHPTDLR